MLDFDRTNYLSDKCIRKRACCDKTKLIKERSKNDLLEIEETSHPNVKSKSVLEVIEEQKQAQFEAQRLLRELLLKAVVTEKQKEATEMQKESVKRLQGETATDSVQRAKKIKRLEADKKDIEKDIRHLKRKIKEEEKLWKDQKKHHKEKKTGKEHLYNQRLKRRRKSVTHDKETIREHEVQIVKSKWELPENDTQFEEERTFSSSIQQQRKKPISTDRAVAKKSYSEKYKIRDNQANSKVVETVKMVPSIEANTYAKYSVKTEAETERQAQMNLEEKRMKERLTQVYNEHKKNKEKLKERERILKGKLLKNLKAREGEKIKIREKKRKELSGQKVLKSVVKVNGKY